MRSVDLKYSHQLKAESDALPGGAFKTSSVGDIIKGTLRALFPGVRGRVSLQRNWHPGAGGLHIERVLLIKEKQLSQGIYHFSMCAKSLSHARLFVTPWTEARQAPLSMGLSRPESWVGRRVLLQGSKPCLLVSWVGGESFSTSTAGRCQLGLPEVSPFACTSPVWGQSPVSHPELPFFWAHPGERLPSDDRRMAGCLLPHGRPRASPACSRAARACGVLVYSVSQEGHRSGPRFC